MAGSTKSPQTPKGVNRLVDLSKAAYDRAIANVQTLGANASKSDREMAAKAAKNVGEQGRRALRALGK